MDRVAAMLLLLGLMVTTLLFMLALFSVSPIFCCCLAALLYILVYFLANEESEIHHAQEFENRFWTVFSVLLTMASIYVRDSPFYLGNAWSGLKMFLLLFVGLAVHMIDRMMHRKEMSQVAGLVRGASAAQSLVKLSTMGVSVEDQLERISLAMANIDQLLVPSTINNFINTKFILKNEREIISVFEDAQPKMLNYLISHVKLALVFYKIKDHRHFRGQHRTQLIELLAVDRVSVLTIISRVLLLRALQLMKITSNPRAEHWVRNIILSTHQDDLSSLKTMTDSKGDYFCMNKLIFDDIRSETVRQDILIHFKNEAAVQQAHMDMGTRKAKARMLKGWRKILSDVDDTLTSSGGSYPNGIDKRYNKKVVYPGVIGLYRELDLGIHRPDSETFSNTGNLVFLSARPHLYKDMSEKHNFAKFQKLRLREGVNGRGGLHTTPSLLAGDLTSGREFMMTNDFEPLARKKFDNFRRFVSIYPEYKHVFICDNGQGDVRAGELMHDQFAQNLDGLFVHLVQDIKKTYGFDSERWRRKGLLAKTCFFTAYPDAALYAATQISPPLIQIRGISRVCQDAVSDFGMILPTQWSSESQKRNRRHELNQSLWRCNKVIEHYQEETVPLIRNPRQWEDGEKVRTTYGIGVIKSFDSVWDLFEVELDLRPLDEQVAEYKAQESLKKEDVDSRVLSLGSKADRNQTLQTVVEEDDESNYLSPATSFDASKKSSKQSLIGIDHGGISTPAPIDEESSLLASPEQTSGHEFIFDANVFDSKATESPAPTLHETVGTSTVDEVNTKSTSNAAFSEDSMSSKNTPLSRGKFFAKIQGKDIKKYTPPSLPKLPKRDKDQSKFSFWSTDSVKNYVDKSNVDKSKSKFCPGEKVSTPYGVGIVVEHRQKDRIVVVDMAGWIANAFLQENIVKREGAGFFGSILRQFGSSAQASPNRNTSSTKGISVGTPIYSPFGEGKVIQPSLPMSEKSSPATPPSSPKALTSDQAQLANTMAISLTGWTLRDGSHPILHCTADIAEKWRTKTSAATKPETSLFSVIGSIVSGTVESLKKIRVPREIEAPIKIEARKFERYYKDGAAVTTAYGDGTVRAFRESDGFYVVSLLMKSGKVFGAAYLREDSMSYRLARGCIEGYPVMTTFGSGVLQSVNPTTGVHNVLIPSFGAICYLQPDQVLRPLKAAVGEDVSTPYGEGKVRRVLSLRYRRGLLDEFVAGDGDNKYEIKLGWGTNVMLFANAETFDRIDDRLEDKGGFGMGWILKFFYSREDDKDEGTQRSRSNSFSLLSQSGVSMKSLR